MFAIMVEGFIKRGDVVDKRLLKLWDRRLPIDPKYFAYHLGYDVKPLDILGTKNKECLCTISTMENGKGVIYINQELHVNRQRFGIAHSLGHHMLGHIICGAELKDHVDSFSMDNLDRLDNEANVFAMKLLAPKEALDCLIERAGLTKIAQLANVLDVSENLVYYRLKMLGII